MLDFIQMLGFGRAFKDKSGEDWISILYLQGSLHLAVRSKSVHPIQVFLVKEYEEKVKTTKEIDKNGK